MSGGLVYPRAQISALTTQCVDVAMACGQHDLALLALINAFARLAQAYPCCTPGCVDMLKELSKTLQDGAADRSAVIH